VYHCPADESFGLISLLAAVAPDTLKVLSGAGLPGELNRRVQRWFVVEKGRIAVLLKGTGGVHRVGRNTIFSSTHSIF
jgi:hypothetical protein